MLNPDAPSGDDPDDPIRVYVDGCYDMCHLGHYKVFEQAKNIFKGKYTTVIAGVNGDEDITNRKGKGV